MIWYFIYMSIQASLQMTQLPASPHQVFRVPIPPVTVLATDLESGDCDLYGRGEWHADVTASLSGNYLVLKGEILFNENAGDNTRIRGKFQQKIKLPPMPEIPSWCRRRLRLQRGSIGGKNTGPIGPSRYTGSGLIKQADVVSDTWDCEVGTAGGTLYFFPATVTLDCPLAKETSKETGGPLT